MSLDLIRRKHKWFTRIILLFITVSFVFTFGYFGSNFGSMTGAPIGSAATVNGENISLVDYYRVKGNLEARYTQQMGALQQSMVDTISFIALDQLVDIKLLAQKAKDLGFRVSDNEIETAIKSIPLFQNQNGEFIGTATYKQIVRDAFHQDTSEYEKLMREQLLAAKLESFIIQTAVVTDEQLFLQYKTQNEKVNLNYIPFTGAEYMEEYNPSEEEIKKYYESREDRFMTPESRTIRYITMTPEIFEKNIQVSDEETNAYYSAYSEEFIADDGGIKPLSEVSADIVSNLKRQRSQAIREDFLAKTEITQSDGINIDKIAKENSIDAIEVSEPFTNSETLTTIPPQITRAAFSQDVGISTAVPMGTSIWITEVKDIIPPSQKPLEDVREDVVKSIKESHANKLARNKAQETLNKIKSMKKEELEKEISSLGLNVTETGYFSILENVPDIEADNIKEEVFNPDKQGVVMSRIYGSKDKFYVIYIKDTQAADPANFELEKENIKEQNTILKRRELIQNWRQTLRRESEITTNPNLFPLEG